ncbi:hypothetical protein TOPH_00092 [Tolypocladium ophioglossoides CBS 100239]|uniref:Uncharacterized protein n=1 Tax=Tolypocladium ophioglossoides (strain CBS 100239) TaxID=1163406 RepID=A0A0L0NLP6_TOLOC|nr:hypothetical protein TOPH_00092 [Tolypocladium ophioglossoides CBS 100239]
MAVDGSRADTYPYSGLGTWKTVEAFERGLRTTVPAADPPPCLPKSTPQSAQIQSSTERASRGMAWHALALLTDSPLFSLGPRLRVGIVAVAASLLQPLDGTGAHASQRHGPDIGPRCPPSWPGGNTHHIPPGPPATRAIPQPSCQRPAGAEPEPESQSQRRARARGTQPARLERTRAHHQRLERYRHRPLWAPSLTPNTTSDFVADSILTSHPVSAWSPPPVSPVSIEGAAVLSTSLPSRSGASCAHSTPNECTAGWLSPPRLWSGWNLSCSPPLPRLRRRAPSPSSQARGFVVPV